jgi:hypothetical protein
MPGNYSSLILIFFEVSGEAIILSRTRQQTYSGTQL